MSTPTLEHVTDHALILKRAGITFPHVMDVPHTCYLAPVDAHNVAVCFLTGEPLADGHYVLHGVKCDGWPIDVVVTP